jgi:gluconolactonase
MFNPPASSRHRYSPGSRTTSGSTNRRSAWVDIQFHGAPTPFLPRGTVVRSRGNLWVVDIPWGRIFRIAPDASVTLVTEYDGEPNGLKFHKDGRVFIADHKHGIMLLDPATGSVTPLLDRPRLERFKGVNDLVFASNGDLYFTDQGQTGHHDPTGRLYRCAHRASSIACCKDIPSPNGLVLNADENTVFLAVTRANASGGCR